MIRRLILKWLLGVDNVDLFRMVIDENTRVRKGYIENLENYLETLSKEKEIIDNMRKLIQVCKNHDIDIDEEIEHIQLPD
jgi:intergrase/recombinase